jgi:hypothetical protein
MGNRTAGLPHDGGKPEVAAALDRARQELEAAGGAYPTNLAMQADLAWISTLIGDRLADSGRDSEALTAYVRALSARERLSKANPTAIRHLSQRFVCIARSTRSNNGPVDRPRPGRPTNGGW